MDINAYRAELKLKLFGNVLKCELNDSTLDSIINASLREIQRYINTTELITIPYARCIDLTPYKVNSVAKVFRTKGYGANASDRDGQGVMDPMYMAQWQMLSGPGGVYNLTNYTYNYAAYNTALQIRNTLSTDLAFRFDRKSNSLYITTSLDFPENITVAYVPRYNNVEDVVSDYWIDMICRMAVAQAKIVLGRVRSRYTQSNALWTQDGETLLQEGNAELEKIRQDLLDSTQLCYPID